MPADEVPAQDYSAHPPEKASGLGSFGGGGSSAAGVGVAGLGHTGLGSLAQSARKKSLKSARIALIVAGILLLGETLLGFVVLEKVLDDQIAEETRGMIVNQQKLAEFRAQAIRTGHLILSGFAAVGVLMLTLAALVNRFPVFCTIGGLVLYLGLIGILFYLNPETLTKGLIVKIIIIACLAKAISAAIAYEKSLKEHQAAVAAGAGGTGAAG